MIFTLYLNDFWHKRKIYNFDPYNVFLDISTNIPQQLKTGFVVQGHIYIYFFYGLLSILYNYNNPSGKAEESDVRELKKQPEVIFPSQTNTYTMPSDFTFLL